MLFDLRSRGRRRAVQVIYLGLALLMLGGLVLFGVGAGSGGGLLNAFTNNGSGNGQGSAVNAQTRAAIKQTQKTPNSPAAWSALVVAYFTAAGEGNNYDQATATYTASGKRQLSHAATAWAKYLQLTGNKPDSNVANLMAEAYGTLQQYANEASAWEYVVAADPGSVRGYECLAASAYAAKQTRKGTLAAAKAVTLVPKAQRLQLQQLLNAAKTDPTVAQQC